jgi:hypothetical protein
MSVEESASGAGSEIEELGTLSTPFQEGLSAYGGPGFAKIAPSELVLVFPFDPAPQLIAPSVGLAACALPGTSL